MDSREISLEIRERQDHEVRMELMIRERYLEEIEEKISKREALQIDIEEKFDKKEERFRTLRATFSLISNIEEGES